MNAKLDALRLEINAIDQQLLSLLSERATLAGNILQAKEDQATTDETVIFDPQREDQVLQKIVAANTSKLPDAQLRAIFQSIMNACRNLQIAASSNAAPFRVSIQGDIGSYSEQAIQQYCLQKNLPNLEINYAITSEQVLLNISNHTTAYGLVALNNSHGGLVKETIEALHANRYRIVDSVVLKVEHSLLCQPQQDPATIKRVYSHPQAIKQCRDYLQNMYPHLEIIAWQGTAKSAADLSNGLIPTDSAVIAHANCASQYDLTIINSNIQDLGPDNETLFLLITGAKG